MEYLQYAKVNIYFISIQPIYYQECNYKCATCEISQYNCISCIHESRSGGLCECKKGYMEQNMDECF